MINKPDYSGNEEVMLEGGDDQVQVMQLVKKNEDYALGVNPRVKGCLRQKVEFWEKVIKATVPVMNMNKQGYILPLVSVLADKQLSNQRSVLEHEQFVSETIAGLQEGGCIRLVAQSPRVCSSLLVVGSSGKKRLVINLRYVKSYLQKI